MDFLGIVGVISVAANAVLGIFTAWKQRKYKEVIEGAATITEAIEDLKGDPSKPGAGRVVTQYLRTCGPEAVEAADNLLSSVRSVRRRIHEQRIIEQERRDHAAREALIERGD